ncbi:MAG: 50S ribosomal protein L21 [Eubacteriales bacterium]|nr:50S ribosomal protein L21 [Eubacteriales bacterium]
MYAIIAAGGRQYKVSQGETIFIDRVNAEPDTTISFDVLMLGGENGLTVGAPIVEGAKVEGKVVKEVKGEKIRIYKYKSKKDYHRTRGHREKYTQVEITAIQA